MTKVLTHSIHLYANGESLIECDIVCNCTKIYDVEGFPEGGDQKLIVSCAVDELGDKLSGVHLTSKIVSKVEGEGATGATVPIMIGAARQEEKVFVLKAKSSMHLNANNKIFLIIVTYE